MMNDINLDNYKIMIFTRSMNSKLFEISSDTIRLPFKHVRLKHTSSPGYLYKVLSYDIDYAINIDEDAFVIDPDKLVGLLKYFIANDYVNCGFPDGGVLDIRTYNPVVTNPFFNIFNVRKIKKHLNYDRIEEFDFTHYDYESKAPKHLFKTPYIRYEGGLEPYYPFFLWLNINFKVLYLDAETHPDGYTTLLKDQNGDIFLSHAWFARYYETDPFHEDRINNLYYEATGKKVRSFNTPQDRKNEKIDKRGIWITKYKLALKRRLKRFRLVKYV